MWLRVGSPEERCVYVYLRTSSVVFTPNQDLVILEKREMVRIKKRRNKSVTGKSHV